MRTAGAAVAAFRSGQASVPELLEETLAHIAERDGKLNSFITLADPEDLRRQAVQLQAELDAGRARGPLHGIPLGVKDVIETKGLRTTGGSAALDDFIPERDAHSVEMLRKAGALIVGKNNTHEFAFGVTNANARFGQCHNPWDTTRVPGGSSGGGGSAVGGGLLVGSLSTDTGASIRRPAAFCGAVGLKPSLGRVSRRGAMLLSWSLDHVGPIAASVRDAVAMLDAIAGHDPEDTASRNEPWASLLPSLSQPHGIVSAGVPRHWIERYCESGIAERFEAACAALTAAGVQVRDIDPPFEGDLLPALRLISLAEAHVAHQERYASRGSRYSDEIRTLIELGSYIPASHYIKAQQLRAQVQDWLARTYAEVDLIVSPTMPTVAPPIERPGAGAAGPSVVADSSAIFCAFGALGGLPSCSLPMGLSQSLPCGLLLTGPSRRERDLLRLAAALEGMLAYRDTLVR